MDCGASGLAVPSSTIKEKLSCCVWQQFPEGTWDMGAASFQLVLYSVNELRFFKWSESSRALTASGAASDLQTSEDHERSEEGKQSGERAHCFQHHTDTPQRKWTFNGDADKPAHAYVSTPTSARAGRESGEGTPLLLSGGIWLQQR